MKWSIALLLVSGLGAAVCAAFLVGSLRADQSEVDQNGLANMPDVEVLLAAGPLPAMTVLDAESVIKKKMTANTRTIGSIMPLQGSPGAAAPG